MIKNNDVYSLRMQTINLINTYVVYFILNSASLSPVSKILAGGG